MNKNSDNFPAVPEEPSQASNHSWGSANQLQFVRNMAQLDKESGVSMMQLNVDFVLWLLDSVQGTVAPKGKAEMASLAAA